MLCSDYATKEQFVDHVSLSEGICIYSVKLIHAKLYFFAKSNFLDLNVTEDVIKLVQTLSYFEQQMSDIFGLTFEKELSQLKSPDIIMSDLLVKIRIEMGFEVSNFKLQC